MGSGMMYPGGAGNMGYVPAPEEEYSSPSPQIYIDQQYAAGYAPDMVPPSEYYDHGLGGGSAAGVGGVAPQPAAWQTPGTYEYEQALAAAPSYASQPAYAPAPSGGYAPVANSALAYPPPPPPKSERSQGIGGWTQDLSDMIGGGIQGASDAAGRGLQGASDALFALFDDASRVFTNGTQPPPLPSPGLGMGGPIPGSGGGGGGFGDGDWSGAGGGGGGFEGSDAMSSVGPPGTGGLPGGPQMPFTFGSSVQQNGPRGTGGLPSGPPMPFTFAPPEDDRGYDPGFPPLIPGVVPVPPGGVPLPIPIPIPPGGVPIVPIPPVGPPGAGGLPGGPTRMIDIIPPLPPGGGAPPPPVGPPGPVMPRNPAPTPPAPAPAPAPYPTPAPAPAPAPGGYGGPPMQAAPTQGTPLITPSGEVYGTLETKPNGQTVVKRLPKGRPNRWNIPQLPTTDPRQMLIDMGIANQALPPGITQRVPPGFALPPGFLMPEWAEQTPLPPPLYDQLRGGMGARGTQQQGGAGRRNRDRR